MKIGNGQEISRTLFDLLRLGGAQAFRAVTIAARIVGRSSYAAGLTDLDMTAECGGAAQLYGAHHTAFDPADVAAAAIDKGVAVPMEDIGDFK